MAGTPGAMIDDWLANGSGDDRFDNGTADDRFDNGTADDRLDNGTADERLDNGTGVGEGLFPPGEYHSQMQNHIL